MDYAINKYDILYTRAKQKISRDPENIDGHLVLGFILCINNNANKHFNLDEGIDKLMKLGKIEPTAYFHLYKIYMLYKSENVDYVNAFEMFKLFDPFLAIDKRLMEHYFIHARQMTDYLYDEYMFMRTKVGPTYAHIDYSLTEYDIYELKRIRLNSINRFKNEYEKNN